MFPRVLLYRRERWGKAGRRESVGRKDKFFKRPTINKRIFRCKKHFSTKAIERFIKKSTMPLRVLFHSPKTHQKSNLKLSRSACVRYSHAYVLMLLDYCHLIKRKAKQKKTFKQLLSLNKKKKNS